MNCQETHTLLHGYADRELDLVKTLEIDQHLQDCPGCAQAHADLQAVRAAVKAGAPYFEAPPELYGRIRELVRPTSQTRATSTRFSWRWLGVAASLALAALAGWGVERFLMAPSSASTLTQELVASHIRSQMEGHKPVDVESSDLHTVKPWFDGRVDFSPPVPDLSGQGFTLLGGRLDYLDNQPVAVLVYQRRKHLINLFIWKSEPAAQAGSTKLNRQGFNLVNWSQSGMTYWAVSNLNEAELEEFGRLVRNKVR
jgi:anti-sigma factor RsiW